MDYKYIEQLIERYFLAETTLEEEEILRSFFSQDGVPAHLAHMKPLFSSLAEEKEEVLLSDDFDERMMEKIGMQTVVKARTVSLTERLKPLFRAAAIVAIVLTLGNAAQMPYRETKPQPMAQTSDMVENGKRVSVVTSDSLKNDSLKRISEPTADVVAK